MMNNPVLNLALNMVREAERKMPKLKEFDELDAMRQAEKNLMIHRLANLKDFVSSLSHNDNVQAALDSIDSVIDYIEGAI